jgi:DNA topoisomerase-3
LTCGCGLIAKSGVVFKDGPNKGKGFFGCVKTAGKCNFFEWDTSDPGASNANSHVECYKCKQIGHMGRDCREGSQPKRDGTRGRGRGKARGRGKSRGKK